MIIRDNYSFVCNDIFMDDIFIDIISKYSI